MSGISDSNSAIGLLAPRAWHAGKRMSNLGWNKVNDSSRNQAITLKPPPSPSPVRAPALPAPHSARRAPQYEVSEQTAQACAIADLVKHTRPTPASYRLITESDSSLSDLFLTSAPYSSARRREGRIVSALAILLGSCLLPSPLFLVSSAARCRVTSRTNRIPPLVAPARVHSAILKKAANCAGPASQSGLFYDKRNSSRLQVPIDGPR
jgi:hypothetical protein